MAEENKGLALTENVTAVQIYTDGEMDPLLKKIEEEVKSFIPVLETVQGRKDIASLGHKIARSKTFLDDLGSGLIEESQKIVKAVNKERKGMRDRLDALKAKVRKPLTDWETEEAEKTMFIDRAIRSLSAYSITVDIYDAPLPSSEMMLNYNRLKEIKIDDFYKDRANEASIIKDKELVKIEKMIADRILVEAEQAELDLLRKEKETREEKEKEEKEKQDEKKRLDKIREEEKIKAENKHNADLAKIEKENADEIKKVKYDAIRKAQTETDRIAKIEEERIETARELEIGIQAEEKAEIARQTNKTHRKKINNNIMSAMVDLSGIKSQNAKVLIKEIVAGRIPNVNINY